MFSEERFNIHFLKENLGYRYICETTIYCPFYEIGIEAIERTETSLSYIYETILKFVDAGINTVGDLCEWLGIDEKIAAEIISDMASYSRLIHRSSNTLVLTPEGKAALTTLTKIQKRKMQLNAIIVNTVSGEIMDESPGMLQDAPPPKPYMYLDREYEIGLAFLNANFETIRNIYDEQKARSSLLPTEKNTLFRFLDITYQKLKYAAFRVQIYIHEDNKNLLFDFTNNRGFDYSSVVHKQIQRNTQGASWLFERDVDNGRFWPRPIWNHDLYGTNLKNTVDAYYDLQKGNITLSEFHYIYTQNRDLLSGECEDLMQSAFDFASKNVIIVSPHILKYLTNPAIISNWISMIGRLKIEVFYSHSENATTDKNIQNAIARIFDEIPKKLHNQIHFYKIAERFDRTIIIYKPGFVIGITYDYVFESSGKMLLQEISGVSFDPAVADRWIRLLKEAFSERIIDSIKSTGIKDLNS